MRANEEEEEEEEESGSACFPAGGFSHQLLRVSSYLGGHQMGSPAQGYGIHLLCCTLSHPAEDKYDSSGGLFNYSLTYVATDCNPADKPS
eukprot:1152460-Amphidinium_carterae.1